jgi:hypothetical protein
LQCRHISSFRADDQSHLTWTARVPTDGRDVFVQSCCDCTLKSPPEVEEMITHRMATLILTEEDTRLAILFYASEGTPMTAASEKGKRIMRSVGS